MCKMTFLSKNDVPKWSNWGGAMPIILDPNLVHSGKIVITILRSGALEQHLSQFHCTKKVGVTTQSIHGTTVYLYVYLHETIKVKHSWIGKYAIRPMDLSWDCSLSNHPLLEEKISVVAGWKRMLGRVFPSFHEKGGSVLTVRTMAGPMIASFFDSSNLTADESSNDQSPVLIVENIPIVSNWWGMNCPGKWVQEGGRRCRSWQMEKWYEQDDIELFLTLTLVKRI